MQGFCFMKIYENFFKTKKENLRNKLKGTQQAMSACSLNANVQGAHNELCQQHFKVILYTINILYNFKYIDIIKVTNLLYLKKKFSVKVLNQDIINVIFNQCEIDKKVNL